MTFTGLLDKFLTEEEKADVSNRYNLAKENPTLSLKDRNQILVEAYFYALHKMNKYGKNTSY